MVAKVRAALAARTDAALVVVARTDALAPNGWDDTLARARAYHDAGADMVFLDGLKTREDIERAGRELEGIPQLLNSMLLTPAEARALGFKLYIQLGVMLRHFADFRRSLEELRDTGLVALEPADAAVEPITELLRGV
jgi:2-methylisocitrate lyase-like PEP mutase family enzyme